MKKISVCTVCKNRLNHLRETLPQNIKDSLSLPNLEFVLLNYNSQDNIDDWIQTEMACHLQSGKLKYYKTSEPEFFSMSHSRNMACRLAEGDIICMIDADNYAGFGYYSWVLATFEQFGENCIITTIGKDFLPARDTGGKLAFSTSLFYSARGYDESFIGYGMDDIDLVNRLEKSGGTRKFISNAEFLKFIEHPQIDRLNNFYLINNIKDLFIKVTTDQPNPSVKADVIYILKDNTFFQANYSFCEDLKNDIILSYGGWKINNELSSTGIHQSTNEGFLLSRKGEINSVFHLREPIAITKNNGVEEFWKRVEKNEELFNNLIMSYSECFNREKFKNNDIKHTEVNNEGWGRGGVILNSNGQPSYITLN